MSLEQRIEELSGTVAALTAIMQTVTVNQERLLAGQQAAIEKVAAGNPDKPTRGRKPKDAPANAPADTASQEDAAATASDETPTPPSEEKSESAPAAPAAEKEKVTFGVAAKKWMEKAEKGSDAYKARGAKVVAILANFGAGKMSELKDEDDAKALFFLKRTVKDLPVNFDADYDFDGPFDQPEPAAAEAPAADYDDDDMFA